MKWILWLALLPGLFFTFSCKKSDPELESKPQFGSIRIGKLMP
jgi:hypothetical protein